MRALFESLARVEDRVLWALVSMVVAYFAWGAWAARRRGKRGASARTAEPAPEPSGDDDDPR